MERLSQIITFVILFFSLTIIPGHAQTQKDVGGSAHYHTVTISSTGNLIELKLYNSTSRDIEDISLTVGEAPEWVKFEVPEITVDQIAPGEQYPVSLSFGIGGEATLNDTASIRLVASNAQGSIWSTTIRLKAGAPNKFELSPNYPNPFNPSTTISYVLPVKMRVQITIYNMLGQRITTLVDEEQSPGSHEIRWDGSGYASGLYFYRVTAEGPEGRQIGENRKMLLVK